MDKLEYVQLSPQEMVISNRDLLLSTLLGSCVAICLVDGNGTGAICHAMLPHLAASKSEHPDTKEKLKFVDSSLALMVERFAARGSPAHKLKAKVYGGATMFDVERNGMMDVGSKNVDSARTMLDRLGITISAMDVGGNQGRKITFNPGSGDVTVYLVPADKLLCAEVRF